MNENMLEIMLCLFQDHVDNHLDFLVNKGTFCIELQQAGYGMLQIDKAFNWLQIINNNPAEKYSNFKQTQGTRIYNQWECEKLTQESRGLLYFMENYEMIDGQVRELIIDRAMALDTNSVNIDQLRSVIILVMINTTAQDKILDWMKYYDSGALHSDNLNLENGQ